MAENNSKNKELAVAANVSLQTVSYWRKKNLKPTVLHAFVINDFTKGFISMEELGHG